MSKSLDPFSAHGTWREFLYHSVLLPYETKGIMLRPGAFDKKSLASGLGLHVVRKTKLADMDAAEKQYRNYPDEFLVFFSKDSGWEPLFQRLRDTTAHGDYGKLKANWIQIRHRFKGPRDKVESTRMFGSLKFQTVRAIVQFINLAH
jgi:hypothetical protein